VTQRPQRCSRVGDHPCFRLDGVVPSLEAFLQADQAGTPIPIDTALAGDQQRQGITGLDVVTFPDD
jgi:hypothetical protein